jgi:putative spermidine/putrescine transport system ATP-binding protein
LTAGLAEQQPLLLMIRPEKAQALSVQQAASEALLPGWNQVAAKVTETLFLGESQTCSVITPGGTAMTVKALSASGMPLKAGDDVRIRWAASDACVYTEWADSDLNKAAGAH